MIAPIILFVFNRPNHTKAVVDALSRNLLAESSDLIIYADAPKIAGDIEVIAVRKMLREIRGFKSVSIVEREVNYGLAGNIIDGVTSVINRYGRAIVLEDDLITSPYFLTFMNDSLTRFEKDERVISVHGYVYPTEEKLPEVFFLKGADCWGWATWKRGWDLFNADAKELLANLQSKKLINEFDFRGAYNFSGMLKDQAAGISNSWAIRWYASAYLANKLTLYPGRSLIFNIGIDNSGTNCKDLRDYDVKLTNKPIDLRLAECVADSPLARIAFINFFNRINANNNRSLPKMTKNILKNMLPPVLIKILRRLRADKRLFIR